MDRPRLRENTRMKTTTDFLIAGAGPGGLILGLELTRLGYQVDLLERLPRQQRTVCGEYLSPEGRAHLLSLGLEGSLSGFQAVHGMILYSPNGQEVHTTFPEGKFGVSLNRQVFQERLAQELLRRGGRIHYGEAVSEIEILESGIRVNQHRAPWLIGADGRQSTVARLMEMGFTNPAGKRIALHCYLRPHAPLSLHGQMHILPDGSYVGINPIDAREVNFSLVTEQEALREFSAKELLNFWIRGRQDLHRQFPLITDEPIKATFPISRESLEIVKGPVALIGDASGFIDPLTGEGMTTAIKSARLLAREIEQQTSVAEAFKSYEHHRRNDFSEKEKLNRGFQRLIRNKSACEAVALILKGSDLARSSFIGTIGNIYTPSEALRKMVSGYLTARF